jgi:hypothetical protein
MPNAVTLLGKSSFHKTLLRDTDRIKLEQLFKEMYFYVSVITNNFVILVNIFSSKFGQETSTFANKQH